MHGLLELMKINNKPFGDSVRKLFCVGDLVEWKLYKSDGRTGEINPVIMTGIIVEIYSTKMASRYVWFAKIFEAKTAEFYQMSLMTLTLIKD